MSHCIVPNWNSRHHQRQDQEIQLGEERHSNRSHQSQQNLSTNYVVPMSHNYEVGEEMRWESREQPAVVALMHGHSEIIGTGLPPRTKPHTWINRTGDTLESLVHQATNSNSNMTTTQQRDQDHDREQIVKYSSSIMPGTSSCGKWRENMNMISTTSQARQMQVETNTGMKKMRCINMPLMSSYPCGGNLRINSMGSSEGKPGGLDVVIKKRVRCGKNINSDDDEVEERTLSCAGADASATDTTMMSSWTSFESSPTFKTTATINTHHHRLHSHSQHCSENHDEEFENKGESLRYQSATRRRAAVVHNQSERRRRDRINEKMKALQKLVPNASKTDKASMLDEVIEYLKQLQAQVHMLSSARTIPQMVMPFGMQQQLQMSILGRMGMGMGMGMLDVNMNFPRNVPPSLPPLLHGVLPPIGTTTTTPSFVPPPFTMPSLVPPLIGTPMKPNIDSTLTTSSTPNFNDAYGTFLAQQSMNMDFFNKMAALYRQQANQPSKKQNALSQTNNGQRDK